ncbi:MAG: response regulator [Cyclobacteriaceae bacterium]|nr:response regulator [Cyclobacteriaceae bacterium]MDX5467477.1 response regulator [Cyclobacteriaceae bacterium]
MEEIILLVDDDPVANLINSKIVKNILPGSTLKIFENGQLAFEFLQSNPKNHYRILLDLNMPVLNGWGFLEKIQDLDFSDGLKVHILSSSSDSKDIEKSKNFPQVGSYTIKPLTPTTFKGILESGAK